MNPYANPLARHINRLSALVVFVLAYLVLAAVYPAFAQATECEIHECAKEAVSWDAATQTLTMDNAKLDLTQVKQEGFLRSLVELSSSGESATQTVTLKLVGENTINPDETWSTIIDASDVNLDIVGPGKLDIVGACGDDGILVHNGNITAKSGLLYLHGANCTIDCSLGTFTLDGASVGIKQVGTDCDAIEATTFVAKSGDLRVDGSYYGVRSTALSLCGATLYVDNTFEGLHSEGKLDLKSGEATISKSEQAGLCAVESVTISGAKVWVKDSPSAFGMLVEQGGFTMSAGSLGIQGCQTGIYVFSGSFDPANTVTVKGGSIGVTSTGQEALYAVRLAMKGGSLRIDGCRAGINLMKDLAMTGGTLSVTNVTYDAIFANTKLSITGGSVTAQCKSAKRAALTCPTGMSNKPACLKSVKGKLCKGAAFLVSGSTYVVDDKEGVTLKSYGGTSKKPSVNKVSFGGVSYPVHAIASKAFSTAKGKKVTQVTIGANVGNIGGKAFYGTSKLAVLNLKKFGFRSATIAKTAFAKCGKSNGSKLTVTCKKANRKAMKKLLVKKGLSKKAKFK